MKFEVNKNVEELLDKAADLMVEAYKAEAESGAEPINEEQNFATITFSIVVGIVIIAFIAALGSIAKSAKLEEKANAKNAYKVTKDDLDDAARKLKDTVTEIEWTVKKEMPDYAKADAFEFNTKQLKWITKEHSDEITIDYVGALYFNLGFINVKKYAQAVGKYNEMILTEDDCKEFITKEAKKFRDIVLKVMKENLKDNDLLTKHSGLYIADRSGDVFDSRDMAINARYDKGYGITSIGLWYITDPIVNAKNPLLK